MTDLTSMYGDEEEENREPAKKYQIMNGLKLSGAHIQRLQVGGQAVEIPGVRYMQLLEEELRDAKRKIRHHESNIQRLERRIASLEKSIAPIKNAKFFPTYE